MPMEGSTCYANGGVELNVQRITFNYTRLSSLHQGKILPESLCCYIFAMCDAYIGLPHTSGINRVTDECPLIYQSQQQ